MSKKKKQKRTFEFRTTIDGVDIIAVPTVHSDDLDHLLERRKSESFVIIPLIRPGKKRRTVDKLAAMARRKAELPADEWHDGELRVSNSKQPVPAVFAFNVRRRYAREIAEKAGVKFFFWGTSGAPVEQHAVKMFKDDGTYAWKAVRGRAFDGLLDVFDTVRNFEGLQAAIRESQTTVRRFWQLVFLVLGVCIAAGLLYSSAVALLGAVAKVALYPVVIPAVFVGIYLRVLVRKGEQQARDFTVAEAEENWHKVAPHLLALWVLCFVAVLMLTWMQAVPEADFTFLGRTGGLTTSFIICVWMLLPIADSRDVKSLFNSAIEAGVSAALSILAIKISLYVTDQITNVMWEILAAIIPLVIPERLKQVIDFFVDIGAEIFFVAVLLGYAWSKTRQQFTRL
ncbi:MAG: hypothetical protein WBN34_09405 [Woeseia sp.]